MNDEYRLIKIFSELYVGFNKRSRAELIDANNPDYQARFKHYPYRLAFITPHEDNAAGRKRKETVDAWTRENDYQTVHGADGRCERIKVERPEELKSQIVKNIPREGFKLAEEIRRTYWGGGNVVWRIEHPDNYEFEISSANLARIVTEVGIEKGGLIPGKCIFGRLGKDNILIPEGSELWEKAYKDAEKIEQRSKVVSTNDVTFGSICQLKAGEGIYLGHYYVTRLTRPSFDRVYGYSSMNSEITPVNILSEISAVKLATVKSDKKYHCFLVTVNGNKYIKMYAEKKVLSVSGNDEKYDSVEKCKSFLNGTNDLNYEFAASGTYTYSIVAFAFTEQKPKNISFKTEDIISDYVENNFKINYSSISCGKLLTVEKNSGGIINNYRCFAKQHQDSPLGRYAYIPGTQKSFFGQRAIVTDKGIEFGASVYDLLGYSYHSYGTLNSSTPGSAEIIQQEKDKLFKNEYQHVIMVVDDVEIYVKA